MKRVFVVFLICVIFLPVISFADTPAYLGAWIRVDEFAEGMTHVNFFQLLEDHYVYYVSQGFYEDQIMQFDDRNVYTWKEIDDNSFQVFRSNDKTETFTLTDSDHLDSGHARVGAIPFSYHVAEKEKEQEEKQKAADMNPVGKWSFYWDARELNKALGKSAMDFDIESFSLFLMDDGSAYMQKATVKSGGSDFFPELLSGIWIGDASDMTIRISDFTRKAWIDDSGRLFYKLTDSMALIFNRVPLFNHKEGMLNE